MKILVAAKIAASLDEEFELVDARTVDPDFVEWHLNEWDACALEEAVRIREGRAAEGDEVIVVCVGEESAEEGLRGCLANGADRAIRIWDESLPGADALAVASVLAAVARREAPDLVLAGVQSSDAANSATGVAMAGYLALPHVAVVKHLDWDVEAASATVKRELEGGAVELLQVPTPAVLTIQTGINEPRYANLRAIKQAREKPLEELSLAELGLEPAAVATAAGSRTTALTKPAASGRAEMIEGSPAEVAARILELVAARGQG
ncbi:MAG: electron transfer flavoprotein subunit beta/FixA family protein [Solirubrobacterales bacterium]